MLSITLSPNDYTAVLQTTASIYCSTSGYTLPKNVGYPSDQSAYAMPLSIMSAPYDPPHHGPDIPEDPGTGTDSPYDPPHHDPEKPDNPASETKYDTKIESGPDQHKVEYSSLQYIWHFENDGVKQSTSESHISHVVSNLTDGKENTLEVDLTVSCEKRAYKRSTTITTEKKSTDGGKTWVVTSITTTHGEDEEEKNKTDLNYTIGTESASLDVYTKPYQITFNKIDINGNNLGTFYNVQPEWYIHEALTTDNVKLWATQCGKYYSWKNQSNSYDHADNCKVTYNQDISATWYNKCAEACGIKRRVTRDKDYIEARFINELINAVNNV